jgi:hypothetical protein
VKISPKRSRHFPKRGNPISGGGKLTYRENHCLTDSCCYDSQIEVNLVDQE